MRDAIPQHPVTPSSAVAKTLTLADTEYEYTFAAGQWSTLFQAVSPTASWRWSWSAGVVAAGGHMVGAGGAILQCLPPYAGVTLYLASSTAGTVIYASHETSYTP